MLALPNPGIIAGLRPAPFAGRSRWEIVVVGPALTHDVGIQECEFAVSPGGADQCIGGSAYGSGPWDVNYPPERLFDDTTLVAIAQGPNSAIGGYNFGTLKAITHARLKARAIFPQQMPRAVAIRSSDDGVSFNFHGMILDPTSWTDDEVREYAVPSANPQPIDQRSDARIWAIRITARAGGGGGTIRCGRFELATSSGGANIISSPLYPYCSSQNQLPAERALLSSLTDSWAADFSSGIRLGAILPAAEGGVAELRLGCMTNESANDMPGAFDIQWSVDGVNWTTTDTYTGQTFSSGEVKTYAVSA